MSYTPGINLQKGEITANNISEIFFLSLIPNDNEL